MTTRSNKRLAGILAAALIAFSGTATAVAATVAPEHPAMADTWTHPGHQALADTWTHAAVSQQ